MPPYNPRLSIPLSVPAENPARSNRHFPNGFPMTMPNIQFLFRLDYNLSLDPWSEAIIRPESETCTTVDVYAGGSVQGPCITGGVVRGHEEIEYNSDYGVSF